MHTPKLVAYRHYLLFILFLFISACGVNEGSSTSAGEDNVNAASTTNVQLALKAPADFSSPFCVRVEVAGDDFETLSSEHTYPARTLVIDTFVPNIPVGQGRTVSMGVFESGKCGAIADADWTGSVQGIVIENSEVTIANLDLIRTKLDGIGSVIVRSDNAFEEIRFHGDVVSANSDPIANAECVILENDTAIAEVKSGEEDPEIGIIDTDVLVDVNTNELLIRCSHPDYLDGSKTAVRVVDSNNPAASTFTSVVIMADSFVAPEESKIVVGESTNEKLTATFSFAKAKISTVRKGGEVFSDVKVAGAQSVIGTPGSPAVPMIHRLVAVPYGAEVGLQVTLGKSQTLSVNLLPFQTEPVDDISPIPDDEVFADKAFVKNEKLYQTDGFFPEKACDVNIIGQARDLRIAQVSCAAGQYNPVTDTLKLYDSVDVEVVFKGGKGHFITETSQSAFEPANKAIMASVVNKSAVLEYIGQRVYVPICYGEELLILTHPDFRSAADDLAVWKRDKGITTSVFNVNDGAGSGPDTNDEIDDFIENRYKNCVVRPSYVLLMGDAEYIPTFHVNTSGSETTGSDYQYAMYPQGFLDIFPDFGVGRIPVDTQAQAQIVVDKIVNYESDPPFQGYFDAPFYDNVSLASQFQCCRMNSDGTPLSGQPGVAQRTFAEVSEFARNVLTGQGYTAERIYEETVDDGGYCLQKNASGNCILVQQPYSGDTTPRRYYDGNLLPAAIGPASSFAWDGDTNDILNAFDDGRFLIIHRDHGWENGWGTPLFTTNNVRFDINNGELLPVVYSVNCASALFDNESADGDYGTTVNGIYFAEHLIRKEDGGAVGILGDTRNSPSWPNTALTKGFIDATWPTALSYGGAVSQNRLGDILNHGKMFLATQIGVAGAGVNVNQVISEYFMWHVIGDPTLEMWTSNPYGILLPGVFELIVKEQLFEVIYAREGAVITAFQETPKGIIPIGRGSVEDGVAVLDFVQQPDPDTPVMLSASLPNAVSVLLTERGSLPDLKLSLEVDSPVLYRGQNIADLLAVTVENAGKGNAQGTIFPDGSVQVGGYMIDLVLSADAAMPAGSASVPAPGGVAFVEDGLLQGGRISRTPDVSGLNSVALSTSPPINSDIGGVIPLQAPDGPMYLCGRVDPGNAITELNESNNVDCIQVRVVPPGTSGK